MFPQTRGYIIKEGRSLVPSSRGLVLTAFLQRYFQRYVDYGFTSNMEERLDEVSGEYGYVHGQTKNCQSQRYFQRYIDNSCMIKMEEQLSQVSLAVSYSNSITC